MKSKCPFRFVLFMFLCANLFSHAETETDGIEAGSVLEDETLLSIVKFPPAKVLSDKLMGIVRSVIPSQQAEMLPLLFLGAAGYPAFADWSEDVGVTLFFFDKERKPEEDVYWIALAKVEEGAGVLDMLASMKWVYEFREGWLLIASSRERLARIENLASWAEIAGVAGVSDVEINIPLTKRKLTRWKGLLKENVAIRVDAETGEPLSAEEIRKLHGWVDFGIEIVEEMESFRFGINLLSEALEMKMGAQARAATDEFAMFSSPAGGAVEVAQYLPGAAGSIQQSKYKDDLYAHYFREKSDNAGMYLIEDCRELLKRFSDFSLEWSSAWSGEMAAYTEPNDSSEASHFMIFDGDFEDAMLIEWGQQLWSQWIPEWLRIYDLDTKGMRFSFRAGTQTVLGCPVHIVEVSYQLPALESEVNDTDPNEPLVEQPLKAKDVTATFYLAVVDGDLLITSNEASMVKGINEVKSGEPVENSIADAFTLDEGVMFEMRYSLSSALDPSAVANPLSALEGLTGLNRTQLDALELAPLKIRSTAKGGRIEWSFELPMSTFGKLGKAYHKNEQQKAIAR